MSFLELLKKRQSVRAYSSQPVEREKIRQCLEAARLAPSACNSQPWHFMLIDDPAIIKEIAGKTTLLFTKMNKFMREIPALLVQIAESSNLSATSGGLVSQKSYNLIDAGIAAEHICLQAAELGLGTCMVGWFKEKAIKKICGIPSRKKIVLLIALGYPKESNIRDKKRKSLPEIVSVNQWNNHDL